MKADYGYLPANQIAQWAIAQGWKRDNPMRWISMPVKIFVSLATNAPK